MQTGRMMADGNRLQLPWGKLIRLGDSSESALLLVDSECTVGRRKGCDLSFPASKLLSGDHCKITQDQSSGQVWLEDTSTNGTVINMSKLVKKQSHPLQNGDVIHFVYRKNEPEQNIAYVYQSISSKLSDSQDADVNDEEVGQSSSVLMDRIDTDMDPEPVEPMTLPCEPQEVQLGSGFEESQPSTSYNISLSEPSVVRTDIQRERDETEEPERKRLKTVPVDPKPGTEGGSRSADKMEESLSCIICQDLLYDCVSLQPCMHTFCAACYSGWMSRSCLCPTCRCPVERICKNHILNNLVEAYLLQHPDKCRSKEDLSSMDARNKITQDMLQPKVDRYLSDEEGSSDYLFELSDNDSDTSDLSQPYLTCRQCPGYRKDLSSAPWICNPTLEVEPIPADRPSTSANNMVPDEFQCPPHGGHLICTCCLLPMPDRRVEHVGTSPSPQHCLVCQRPFCHLYWGCQRIGCHGCLARFTDLNLTETCLDGVLNNNHYESDVLKDYLNSKGKTWKELLHQSLQFVEEGQYRLSDLRITARSFLCYCCGLRFFKELAYIYRQTIPASDLPAGVMSRPDCYWGRNCRTQIKAHHAMKFNHICEQTRFKN